MYIVYCLCMVHTHLHLHSYVNFMLQIDTKYLRCNIHNPISESFSFWMNQYFLGLYMKLVSLYDIPYVKYCLTRLYSILPMQGAYIQLIPTFTSMCDAIKQNESEISQSQFSVFWLIVHIIFKVTLYNRPYWNWSIGSKDMGSWRVEKTKGKNTLQSPDR